MRWNYFIVALLFLIPISGAQQIGPANYTPVYANSIIQKAEQYVNTVNQSAYLVFYPNLTAAYAYLSKAQAIYNKSPGDAVIYSNEAMALASEQYASIGKYRLVSFLVAMATTIVLGLFLFDVMRRRLIKGRKGKRIKTRMEKRLHG